MTELFELLGQVRDFAETGGVVINYIAAVLAVMWLLIFERILYFRGEHQKLMQATLAKWEARAERQSWEAHQIREKLISTVRMAAQTNLGMIKTLIAICPLLGLMGTVTGMIAVFDVMSSVGMGNARSMADGVSMATIPTMAGMVAALSGVFASALLDRYAARSTELLQDHLTMDH